VEHVYARALLDEGRAADALSVEREVLKTCTTLDVCDAWLVASARRRADILEELVARGVEDARAEPEASAVAYYNATREARRVVGPERICTGTLVDDDLVLTAHHCVVKLDAHGAFTNETVDPSDLQIELGGDYLAWGTVRPRAIVAPPCGAPGGAGDVAVLVL